MKHFMNLQPVPFESMKNGQKTIELRLNDEKRQRIRPGDTIQFTNTADRHQVLVRTVAAIHPFATFEELYQTLPLLQCGYTEETVADAHPQDMNIYYPPELQTQYGVLGIELTGNGEEHEAFSHRRVAFQG